MKIAVFGASGGTGRLVVEQALEAGHKVTAVARKPAAFSLVHEQLTVLYGDVTDPFSLVPIIEGNDAVVSAIGSAGRRPTTLFSTGTSNILGAMGANGVHRFVGVSSMGFANDPNDPFLTKFVAKPILKRVLKHPFADMAKMEAEITRCDRDWTIVRPPMLTNGRRTRRYRTATTGNVPGGRTISRADLAEFLVGCLVDPRVSRVIVGISY